LRDEGLSGCVYYLVARLPLSGRNKIEGSQWGGGFALEWPVRQIAENSGTDGSTGVGKLLERTATTRRRASS